MKMGKNQFYLAILLTVSIGFLFESGITGTIPAEGSDVKRADVIKIDSMAVFGRLEKASVDFLHDAHTKALAAKNLDCTTCHLTQQKRIYPKFKRFADTDRKAVMNIYHNGCIGCHGEMKLAKEKTGPIDCDDCHTGNEEYLSSRQAMGFDKSLHFIHSQRADNQCDTCHHAYNEARKELFYDQGNEGTCRYCHKQITEGNRITMREASHLGCINCHRTQSVKEKVLPPLTCAGCHDPAVQKKIKKQTAVPRMNRNQPDIVLLNSASKFLEAGKSRNQMDFVPFDHKIHEASNDTCRVCHHASMQTCSECHASNGFANTSDWLSANLPNLENAMHKADSERSCLGCHNTGKQDKDCAGCHAAKGLNGNVQEETCIKCHSVSVQTMPPTSTPEEEKSLARLALKSAKRETPTHSEDGLPDVVTIQRLSKQYEAVTFPHRQIIHALMERMNKNRLSGYFHNEKEAICQGCHHHSPVSDEPPQCATCHPKQWDVKTPSMPGIVGAYHLQCMGCHEKMNIEMPAGCIECHAVKKLV